MNRPTYRQPDKGYRLRRDGRRVLVSIAGHCSICGDGLIINMAYYEYRTAREAALRQRTRRRKNYLRKHR